MGSDTSTDGTDQSIRGRIKRKICHHEWSYLWSEREKTCLDCGVVREITKEYTHSDESAEIGETRIKVDKSGSSYSIDKQRYRCTGRGEDSAYFQWFPVEFISLSEEGVSELLDELDRSVDTGTGRDDHA